jgi:hypothetical protein
VIADVKIACHGQSLFRVFVVTERFLQILEAFPVNVLQKGVARDVDGTINHFAQSAFSMYVMLRPSNAVVVIRQF